MQQYLTNSSAGHLLKTSTTDYRITLTPGHTTMVPRWRSLTSKSWARILRF